jgi:hypothetical protein
MLRSYRQLFLWPQLEPYTEHSVSITNISHINVGRCVTFSDFNKNRIASIKFSKSPIYYKISRKLVRWKLTLFHADRRTEGHDEANSRFSQLLGEIA